MQRDRIVDTELTEVFLSEEHSSNSKDGKNTGGPAPQGPNVDMAGGAAGAAKGRSEAEPLETHGLQKGRVQTVC